MNIFTRHEHTPFAIVCRYNDADHVQCPMGVHNETQPCAFEVDIAPNTDTDRSMQCRMDVDDSRACVDWHEAYFGLCEAPLLGSDGKLRRVKRPLMDYDLPWVQDYMDRHPEKFTAFRPGNKHPNLRHRPELSHEPIRVRTHVQPLNAFVDHQFAMENHRRRSTLAIWEQDMLETQSPEPPKPPATPVFETDNFWKPSLEDVHRQVTVHADHHVSHVHTLTPQEAPRHFVPDRPDPDLFHIKRYQEHFASVPKLMPGAKAYTPDFTTLAHINVNHPDNRHYHPQDYPALKERDARIAEVRAEKIWQKIVGGTPPPSPGP